MRFLCESLNLDCTRYTQRSKQKIPLYKRFYRMLCHCLAWYIDKLVRSNRCIKLNYAINIRFEI